MHGTWKAAILSAAAAAVSCRDPEPRDYEKELRSERPSDEYSIAPSSEPFTRYPTIEGPDRAKEAQEFALTVSLTEDLVTPEVRVSEGGTEEGAVDLSGLPASERGWSLDVVLEAPGFELRDGRNAAAIALPRDGDSTRAVFWLTPDEIEGAEKERSIYVLFWHQGRFLAKSVRKTTVVAAQTVGAESLSTASAGDATPSPGAVPLSLSGQGADLTVFFIDNGNGTANVLLGSPHLQYAHSRLSVDPAHLRWIEAELQKIAAHGARGVAAANGTPPPPRKELTTPLLEGFGRELYTKVAPEIFKLAFWHLKDEHGRDFESIQIISDVTGIPWELMRPSRSDGTDEGGFLGVDFRIARWPLNRVHTTLPSPPSTLVLQDLVAVAPRYQEGLPGQTVELRALSSVPGYREVPGRLESFRTIFANPPAGFVHFAGHGRAASSPAGITDFRLVLEDAEVDVSTFRGLFSPAATTHPFVFLNACHLGAAETIGNFVSGWAPAVLEGGGSGYIGALWPVGDAGAAAMGAHFYEVLDRSLEDGTAVVGDALKSGRKLFYQDGDPSFLAYVYYGDPNFVVERRN
jgi:hypothetical protein